MNLQSKAIVHNEINRQMNHISKEEKINNKTNSTIQC